MSDVKALRRYHAGVERALGLFDASNEWADYIAFLSRLLKALQASPPNAEIPLKGTVAKYLAQCLRPSLPSGVHQKALEVYGLIFSLLGRDGLSRDLALYLPGISHTLSFASLSTRPWFLALYDDHILKLPPDVIRPALKAIILSLLPGIEEENSEDFEKTLSTFNTVRRTFVEDGSEEIFWQCLFLASITSPNKRAGALVYLLRYLPKLGGVKNIAASNGSSNSDGNIDNLDLQIRAITTPEPGLLVRCFATGLQDEQSLIQRGFLDVLVTHLPLDSPTLHTKVTKADLDILVTSAMSIVLRRDMGLNRRLWTWFTGSDDKAEPSSSLPPVTTRDQKLAGPVNGEPDHSTMSSNYFETYGLDSAIRSFEKMLVKNFLSASGIARPFRILLSLMDRRAIGGPIVSAMFIPLLRKLQEYQVTAPSQAAFDEVFRSANVFFDGIEPYFVASNVFNLLQHDDLNLVEFILGNFAFEEEEMVKTHIPLLVSILAQRLSTQTMANTAERPTDESMSYREAEILNLLLELFPSKYMNEPEAREIQEQRPELLENIASFYSSSAQSSTLPKFSDDREFLEQHIMVSLSKSISNCLNGTSKLTLLDMLSSAFEKFGARTENFRAISETNLVEHMFASLEAEQNNGTGSFIACRSLVKIIGTLRTFDKREDALSVTTILQLVPRLVGQLWCFLHPSTPQYHVECVDLIWSLRSLSERFLLVDSTVMSIVENTKGDNGNVKDKIANFAVFWTHTKVSEAVVNTTINGNLTSNDSPTLSLLAAPMLYLLDCLDAVDHQDPIRAWIGSLPTLRPFFQVASDVLEIESEDSQVILPGIHRLRKLVHIARQSNSQWKDFSDETGPISAILNWCISIVMRESQFDDLAIEALLIIRLIHEGAESTYREGLLDTLSERVSKVTDGGDLQTRFLDTIQTLIALPKTGAPPLQLLNILIAGISSQQNDANIDKWITLLCNSIPLYSGIVFFSNLLKMTACFCKRIQTYFDRLQSLYKLQETDVQSFGEDSNHLIRNPERSITNLFAGLEYILARAHTQIVDQPRNSVEGQNVAGGDVRSLANNRLTVILCMQDSIKICGQVWFWRALNPSVSTVPDNKSLNYMSARLRNRTRRMLEHLIDAEPQECLETLMGIWVEAAKSSTNQHLVLTLLQTLDGARPKFMMPATFNAIYGRTNPAALDHTQKSTLSVNVSGLELITFLIEYIDVLEDDLLEEIWADCTTFLRDVLANPMPHRHILLKLVTFVSVLCRKMENTNFGEEAKMRRELADLCTRLFTAIFTIKPSGLDPNTVRSSEKFVSEKQVLPKSKPHYAGESATEILCEALPIMSTILNESDRAVTIYTGISVNIVMPLFKSRYFPQNMTLDVLILLQIMSKSPTAAKVWRKDISDALNDLKFFQSPAALCERGWMPLIRYLAIVDKGLMPELVSRLIAPTTAGLMFGVGATAARTESDNRTQLNLRRIALVLLASEKDTFVVNLVPLLTKVEELLTATTSTSPSSAIRGDIYLLFRAVALSFSQLNLILLWPVIDTELRGLFADMVTAPDDTKLTPFSHLQGAKLLDLLLLLKPEEFQLHEWLFITDTIDAIHPPVTKIQRPSESSQAALADLMASSSLTNTAVELSATSPDEQRKPWLCTDLSRNPKAYTGILGSFFRQLSIHAFEDTYSLESVDMGACQSDLVADLFFETEL